MLDYGGLQNLQKGPDGGDEIDGQLILVRGTVKFLAGRFKVDKTTIQRIWNRTLESYYNDDTYMLFTAMCFYAKQGAAVENIYLLYLSPDQGIADSAQDFIPETKVNIPGTQVSITVVANLHWE